MIFLGNSVEELDLNDLGIHTGLNQVVSFCQ
jgi:hypothetical protein